MSDYLSYLFAWDYLPLRIVVGFIGGFFLAQTATAATTVYLHRYLTHGAIDTMVAPVKMAFRIWVWLTTGIKPYQWARIHQYHHMFTERERDPHSPKYKGGILAVLLHNVRFYTAAGHDPEVNSPQLCSRYPEDEWDCRVFNYGLVGLIIGVTLAILMFGVIVGGIIALVHWPLYIYGNASINSLAHGNLDPATESRASRGERFLYQLCCRTGYQNHTEPAKSIGTSLNIKWLALITGGEGLHNNHHAQPRNWTMRHKAREYDPARPLIRLACALKLMTLPDLKRAEMKQLT